MSRSGTKTPALEVQGLGKSYGPLKALDEVSLAVAGGEFVGLLGPNGAGKTTLFQILSGLFVPDAGRVMVLGHDVRHSATAALAGIGVVFQQPTLDLDLSVRSNLRFSARLHGMSRARRRERIEAELGRLGLSERADAPARTLSGGNRRRVELARALVHEPSVLLMDEATVGLDPASRRQLLDYVLELRRERPVGVLWATHLVDEVERADRVIILHRGRVLDAGPPAGDRFPRRCAGRRGGVPRDDREAAGLRMREASRTVRATCRLRPHRCRACRLRCCAHAIRTGPGPAQDRPRTGPGPTAARAGGVRAPFSRPRSVGAGGRRRRSPGDGFTQAFQQTFELRHTLSKVGLPLIEPVDPHALAEDQPGQRNPGADDGDDLGRHGGLRRRSRTRTLRRRIRRGNRRLRANAAHQWRGRLPCSRPCTPFERCGDRAGGVGRRSAGPVQSAPEGVGGGRPAMASRKPSSKPSSFAIRSRRSACP